MEAGVTDFLTCDALARAAGLGHARPVVDDVVAAHVEARDRAVVESRRGADAPQEVHAEGGSR
jgi:hypothetical protein